MCLSKQLLRKGQTQKMSVPTLGQVARYAVTACEGATFQKREYGHLLSSLLSYMARCGNDTGKPQFDSQNGVGNCRTFLSWRHRSSRTRPTA